MQKRGDVTASVLRTLAGAAVLSAIALSIVPGTAEACGGLFCNTRPPDPFAPLPVAQNGENVVFSITPDPAGGAPTLVAHIQILYTGDAAKFSWVVPVDAAPVLGVGTDRLFTALAGVTQPRFQLQQVTDGVCIPPPFSGTGGASAGTGGSASSASGGASGAGGAPGGGVMVSFQGAVGPFDAAVIKSDDPIALKMWLTDNGYVVSDGASALIDVYVREHKFFVALKLLNGVGIRSIQPIVMTFRGTEPCVPLRLTAIAANPDMPVILWVLADKRTVPKGFYEMSIDEARIDWFTGGSNYFGPKGLVSLAANEVGGKAFVTEYAGTSTVARASVYTNGQFNVAALQAAMTPPAYVQQVIAMGLSSDPQTLPLLAKYIPMPQAVKDMGITESQFYGNLATYWAQFAFPGYDLAGLTQAISTSIIKPRMDAQMMIDARPYLTRLNTFISPDEMDRDPLFFVNRDLPEVSNVHTAALHTMCGNMEFMACNAPLRLDLSDGRQAWVRAGSTAFSCTFLPTDLGRLKTLPAAHIAWEREEVGEGTRMLDNTAAIQAGLQTNNNAFPAEQARFPIGPTGAGGGPGTATGGISGSGGRVGTGTGGAGGAPTGGAGPSDGTGGLSGSGGRSASAQPRTGGEGCGCATGGAPTSPAGWLGALVVGLALLTTRRRARVAPPVTGSVRTPGGRPRRR
ncbi:MAG: DUF2330 domain-containing protein [Pseudomonadota bacterium]